MAVFIALLKGINVGKSRRIKMEDLRKALEALGLRSVETYIQSGNVVFESDDNENILRKKIEKQIEASFGFEAVVVLRTAAELEKLIEECPFSAEEIFQAEDSNKEGESLYALLLAEEPGEETGKKLDALKSADDELRFRGRDVYILLRHSIRNSKPAVKLQKLEPISTARNWKTLQAISSLAKEKH